MILRYLLGLLMIWFQLAWYLVCGILWLTVWPSVWDKARVNPKDDWAYVRRWFSGID